MEGRAISVKAIHFFSKHVPCNLQATIYHLRCFDRCLSHWLGFDDFLNYASKMSPLGNAPAEDCARYCVSMFSDFTRYVTLQNLYHDGGFSNMGMSGLMMEIGEE